MTAPTPSAAEAADLGEVRRRYLEHLLAPDARAAWDEIAAALADGARADQVYLEVLTPAMVEIGQLWETARIGVAQEHLATQITQTVLARLAPSLEDAAAAFAGDRRRSAIVAGTPGELHGIGARMVADFLEASGWEVLLLGPDTPVGEIVALTTQRTPDVVALSTSLSFNLLAAGRVFTRLRELSAPPLLVAGGRAYEGQADRALLAGADVFASDPGALLQELSLRLQ